jgi:serine/threonine-protein phosphatase PGAM5
MTSIYRCLLVAALLATALPCLGADEAENKGVRTLYLIRHGEYDQDDERDPDVGKALVPLGVAQARLLGARLRGMGVAFDSLHASTMTRARQTAEVLADDLPGLELQTTRLLRECTPHTWRQDIMENETEEDLTACVAQIEAAWEEFSRPTPERDQHDLISAHGNVIRYFVTRALKVDTKSWLGMSIGNCSLTVIKIGPDGAMKLLSFSDVGHIPPNLQTRTTPGTPRDLAIP